MKLFMSYYSGEESVAEDIAEHLRETFTRDALEVFMASGWESIAPGDQWEDELIGAIGQADALVVLMSVDALGRPWLNFEIGVAWARKIRILLCCHRGLTPAGLPRPYSSLQAVDLNNLSHGSMLDRIAQAVSIALALRVPEAVPARPSALAHTMDANITDQRVSFASTYRAWSLRPGAHVGEVAEGQFLVGSVGPSRPDRARAANLGTGEALYVRLFLGSTPEGTFVAALVGGTTAEFFERVIRDTVQVPGKLRLAAAFEDGDNTLPIVVIDSCEPLV